MSNLKYSGDLNTKHPKSRFIWIPNKQSFVIQMVLFESEIQAQLIPTDYPKPTPYLINLRTSNINIDL